VCGIAHIEIENKQKLKKWLGVGRPKRGNSSWPKCAEKRYAKQKAIYNKMAKLQGAAFDRNFKKEMLADHKKDIAAFQKEANDSAADFANETLPTLQKHLNAAQKLQ